MRPIDLRSDTVTRPTQAMRDAMATAEVGDDVYGEDPTVNRLQEVAAELTGKEAALLVPSGTMANQVAIRTHTQPGDALIAGKNSHLYLFESGAAAALSGVQPLLVGEDGLFDADDVLAARFPGDDHYPRTRLVCVENTHNASGGRVFPLAAQQRIGELARECGLRLHLDGARIWNASVASGIPARELCAPFDSVAFCLSKGLGAPVGSLLCGSQELIERAMRVRKLFGGAIAERVGPIWGFDAELHELRNMYTRTAQPGLWFIAGSFAQCRIYSKFLGLQIKACEEGMIPLQREVG